MSELDRPSLERALGRIVSGLSIVTVRREEEASAFLASWVQQAGFDPPMLTVAVGRDRPAAGLLAAGASFAVNILSGDDPAGLVKRFVRGFAPGADPFEGVRASRQGDGPEILLDSLASLQCRGRGLLCAGDHLVILGEVVRAVSHRDDGESAVHLRRNGLRY